MYAMERSGIERALRYKETFVFLRLLTRKRLAKANRECVSTGFRVECTEKRTLRYKDTADGKYKGLFEKKRKA